MAQKIKLDVNKTLFGNKEVILYSSNRKFPIDLDFVVNIMSLWRSGMDPDNKYTVSDSINLYVFKASSVDDYCSSCSENLSGRGDVYILRQGAWSLEFDESCFVDFLRQADSIITGNPSLFTAYNI